MKDLPQSTGSIRPATPDDLAVIEQIVADAYGHYVGRIGRKPGPMLDDYSAILAGSTAHVLETPDGVQGLIVLVPEPEAMLLDNVAVRPEAKGQGYGRMLLTFAEQSARAAGLPAVRLYTHEMMVENIALYSRVGYVETHRAEERGLHRVFMLKRLTPNDD